MQSQQFGGALPPTSRKVTGVQDRVFPRVEGRPPIIVSNIRANVADVSQSGIGLVVSGSLKRGDRVQIVVTDALIHVSQEVTGEVMWATATRAGLRWVDLTPDQEEWFRKRFSRWRATGELSMERGHEVIHWGL